MITTIRAEDNLGAGEIEKIINASREYDTVSFEGVFRFEETNKRFFMLGRQAVQSLIMITKPNIRLDFSAAKVFFRLDAMTCPMAFLYFFQTARNVRIDGLDLQIDYIGERTRQTVFGLYNCGYALNVDRSRIEIFSAAQINAVGIGNYGGLNTHLDTRADNLSLTNSYVRVHILPEEFEFPCEAVGLHNMLANSMQVSGCFFDIGNRGTGESQKAIGIYNNGRFCRFTGNNVKANGSHNKGRSLEAAHACGMLDEGMYSLVSNCNIIGEWGGSCVGLRVRGEFTKISGNKILATHTIKGTTVKIEGKKVILSDNILTSTSRNARIIHACGETVTVSGNIMEVLMIPEDCVSGVGAYFENADYAVFCNNQIKTVKDCGLYIKNSSVTVRDNLYQRDGLLAGFVTEASENARLERLFDEDGIRSLPDAE